MWQHCLLCWCCGCKKLVADAQAGEKIHQKPETVAYAKTVSKKKKTGDKTLTLAAALL